MNRESIVIENKFDVEFSAKISVLAQKNGLKNVCLCVGCCRFVDSGLVQQLEPIFSNFHKTSVLYARIQNNCKKSLFEIFQKSMPFLPNICTFSKGCTVYV